MFMYSTLECMIAQSMKLDLDQPTCLHVHVHLQCTLILSVCLLSNAERKKQTASYRNEHRLSSRLASRLGPSPSAKGSSTKSSKWAKCILYNWTWLCTTGYMNDCILLLGRVWNTIARILHKRGFFLSLHCIKLFIKVWGSPLAGCP